jgi:hypothetical protein
MRLPTYSLDKELNGVGMSYEQIQERCFLEHEESKREVQLADEPVFEETKLESTNSQRLVSAGMGFQR